VSVSDLVARSVQADPRGTDIMSSRNSEETCAHEREAAGRLRGILDALTHLYTIRTAGGPGQRRGRSIPETRGDLAGPVPSALSNG
jgi:hypothetical protein